MELTKTQIAIGAGKTVFGNKVKSVLDGMGKTEKLLKFSTNKKLGKKVRKGKYKGFPIVTLTLEERKTCPSSCAHWADCYGNNMPFATRYDVGPEFENMLELELKELQRKYPNGFLVRLHILGDFYSVSYVAKWAKWLTMFPALHIYGYTANNPKALDKKEQAIGLAIKTIRDNANGRFAIRFSGNFDDMFSANSMDDKRSIEQVANKNAFICPVQLDKTDDCGTCGLCWSSNKTVTFITH
jgi:hypothetical protein